MKKRPALVILILAGGGAALWQTGAADRLLHPARYAVTGTTLAPLDAYAEAAAQALGPDERVARLTLPEGSGPVVALADTGSRVFIDPPSARVLDVAPGAPALPAGAPRPLAPPALPATGAVQAARPLARGAPLAQIDWPGERNPDWTVRFAGRQASATVKVADDIGTATPARERLAAIPAGDGPALLAGATVLAAAAMAGWLIARRTRKPAKRRQP